MSGKGMYNSKALQSWLQDLRDCLAGRSADLDAILSWTEMQTSEIELAPNQGSGGFLMFDQIPVEPEEVSAALGILGSACRQRLEQEQYLQSCRAIQWP